MLPLEFQLLLCCAKSEPDPDVIKDLINKAPQWQRVLELAQHHGVRPLLLQSLKSACWDIIPQPIRLELDRFNRSNIPRSLFFSGELLRLVAAFQTRGIPIATFKGIVLAQSVYGDLSSREFGDLDFLVHEVDLAKAEDVLHHCGYRADFPDRAYRSTFLRYHGQYLFYHPETGALVDLHWQLSSKGIACPIQSAEIWSKLRQVRIEGQMVPTLASDDLALFLAAHGTKEGWRRLIWLCDFAAVMSNCHDIDWIQVAHRADRYYSSRSLLLAVLLASTLLGTPAPTDLIEKARNSPAVRALADEVQKRMLRGTSPGELEEFIAGLKTHDRLRDRLRPVVTLLTTRTTGDYQTMPLPKWLWGIYYFTRPFRLARKAAARIARQYSAPHP